MKKRVIFCLFLLTLCIASFKLPSMAFAEIDESTIILSAKTATSYGEDYVDNGAFNSETSTYTSDLEVFGNDGSILLSVAVGTDGIGAYTYQWKNSNGFVLSNSAELILHKKIESMSNEPIMVGDSTYTVTIINSDGESAEKSILVRISDNKLLSTIQSFAINEIPESITNSSSALSFYAKLPVVSGVTTTWQIKTPNATSYRDIATTEKFTFDPSQMLTPENGYGEYRLFAIAHDSKTSKTYYSKTFTINASAPELGANTSAYTISSTVVDNSKANIEAFKFTLSTTANLNVDNIYWYVSENDVLVKTSTGDFFVYEPTTTDAFKVVAKYKTPSNNLIELASYRGSPQVTGTHILIIYIVVAVAVLSIILAISIKITNKKRDVVW